MTSQEKRIEETPDQQIEKAIAQIDHNLRHLDTSLFTTAGDFRKAILRELRTALISFTAERDEAVREKYQELLYAVENKYEGETRHDTALRFIKNAQASSSEASVTPPPTNPTSVQ